MFPYSSAYLINLKKLSGARGLLTYALHLQEKIQAWLRVTISKIRLRLSLNSPDSYQTSLNDRAISTCHYYNFIYKVIQHMCTGLKLVTELIFKEKIKKRRYYGNYASNNVR